MAPTFKRPNILARWARDIPGTELYELIVFDDLTVVSAAGRYSHGGGSMADSWAGFMAGGLDKIVLATIGEPALMEAKDFVRVRMVGNL